MRRRYLWCPCHMDCFPSCLFYVFLYSDYMYFFLTLTYLFMPFPLLYFLHVSLAILINITLLQFSLHHVCLFSRVTLMRRNTFIFLMYVPRVDLNSWFCLDVLWEWLAISSVSKLFDQFPLEAGVSYKRIWLPGFFHSPTSYKAKNYCESPWIWDSGEGVVFRMF